MTPPLSRRRHGFVTVPQSPRRPATTPLPEEAPR